MCNETGRKRQGGGHGERGGRFHHDRWADVGPLQFDLGPPGGQDFDLSRRIYHPDARLVRTRLDEQGRAIALPFSGDEYEANAKGLLAGLHFYEVETDRRVVRFGNVAQVFSAYEARNAPEGGDLIKRGLNFGHLFNDGHRWWLMHLIWDDEREGVAVPRQIFDDWRDIG